MIELKNLTKEFKKPIRGEGVIGMLKSLFSRKYEITIQIEKDRYNFEVDLNQSISQFVREKIYPLTNNKEVYLFYQGQIWDSYSLIIDIIKKARNKITIIDNYIDDSILKMLSKKNKDVEVVILTSNKSNIQNLDVQKFNKEYPTLKVARTDKFHDRFIIIDNKELYNV